MEELRQEENFFDWKKVDRKRERILRLLINRSLDLLTKNSKSGKRERKLRVVIERATRIEPELGLKLEKLIKDNLK